MGTQTQFSVPDELDLVEFFGAEPIERSVEDGYWCYVTTDSREVRLRFSFNIFERSVQTELALGGGPVTTVSHEGATNLRREGSTLYCDFLGSDWRASLTIVVGAVLHAEWSTLRTR